MNKPMDIKEFATRYKVKIRRDGCDDMIAPGKQYCTDMPDRVEYHSHVYDHENGEHFGLCLMYAPSDESGKSGKSGRWSNSKKKLLEAGFQIRQDGDCEGTALFSPHNRVQVKLALKLAGIRTRREFSPEKKAILVAQLAK